MYLHSTSSKYKYKISPTSLNLLLFFCVLLRHYRNVVMKVVLINTYENRGGAAIACNRLTHALQNAGVDACMLTATAYGKDTAVKSVADSRKELWQLKSCFLRERLSIFLQNRFSRKNLFAVSTASHGLHIAQHRILQEADIIHLHWINQGYISLNELQEIMALGKPIVWTLHDMWPVTGICHHARTCNRYTQSCGECMFLQSNCRNDLSARTFEAKKDIYSTAPIHFVACSKWLQEQIEKSALLKTQDTVCNIPNPLDTLFFTPEDKKKARALLGLPQDKLLILFGAVNAADKRKGIDYFINTLEILRKQYTHLNDKIELVVFGSTGNLPLDRFSYPCTTLGYISDSNTIKQAYCAADTYVTPSLEENLPNTIMEAMSCATPCVGFSIGGIPEMINNTNGYVARYKDATDMAHGIAHVLDNRYNQQLGSNARIKVEESYAQEKIARQYIDLYQQLLSD